MCYILTPMLSVVWSCALQGLRGRKVRVEVDIHAGLPHVAIVGLPDAAVRESKDRLYAALRNAHFAFPMTRVTVNLAPADIRKAGPSYDLPIAVAILAATEQLTSDLSNTLIVGEVALDGALRSVHGVLPIAAAARRLGFRRIVVPADNGAEAALVPGLEVIAAPTLVALVSHLHGETRLPVPSPPTLEAASPPPIDLESIRGQAHARRALEIAASGGHNLLMEGPPGTGKTLLARALPGILPPMSFAEQLEVTAIYSVAGALPLTVPLVGRRPFRSPHHTVTPVGLCGGGSSLRPGELSLAHNGVLFLDELPEFDRRALEALRAPLEDRRVNIVRAAGSATFPASFALVAARNPCPCGHHGDESGRCNCTAAEIARYTRRLSGPLLDRFDLQVQVPRLSSEELSTTQRSERSDAVARRVARARHRQQSRFNRAPAVESEDSDPLESLYRAASRADAPRMNAEMRPDELRRHCRVDSKGLQLLQKAIRRLDLSARAYHRVLKVARTIADLDESEQISSVHIAEALQLRQLG